MSENTSDNGDAIPRGAVEQPPNQYEQAKEAVRDGVTPSELSNILHSLPPVYEALVDFEDITDAPIQITVGFEDYHGTREVTEIMRTAGYKVDVTVFSYNRIHYEEGDSDE